MGWQDGSLELTGTVFDGKHGPHPWVRGEPMFENPVEPGWSHHGRFDDPRPDGFGNLPEEWTWYRGYYVYGEHTRPNDDLS